MRAEHRRRWAAAGLWWVTAALGCSGRPHPSQPALVVAYPAGLTGLLSFLSSDEYSASILRNAYEPLVDLDRDLRLVPCLAQSWYSPDELSWVLKLRPDVRFHDGRPLQAEQVAAFLRRANEDPRSRRSFRSVVNAIEVQDAQTLVLRTSRPSGVLHSLLNATLIAAEPGQGSVPVGTGAYRVSQWAPGGDVVLEATDTHRDGRPLLGRIEFQVVPDAHERVRRVLSGRAQLAIDVPVEEMAHLGAASGVRTVSQPGLRVVHLGINTGGQGASELGLAPLADRRVRQALAHAIDRESLVARPLRGHADVAHELVPKELFGHHGALPPRPFDRTRAKKLLAAAGYAGGFSTVLDYVPMRYPAIDAVAAAIAADLRAVGVEARLRPMRAAEFRERVSQRKETGLFLLGWLSATGDAATTLTALVHSASAGLGLYSTYSDAEVDRLLDQASSPVPLELRKGLLQAVVERIHHDVPVVPLYRQHDLYAFTAGLDFRPRLDRRIRGHEIRWTAGAAGSTP